VREQFTEAQASEAIQRLYATGFFSDVKIDTVNNVLVVSVKERPTIASVTFNGMHEFDPKAITKSLGQVGFGQGRVFDRSMLERAEFELKRRCHGTCAQGYSQDECTIATADISGLKQKRLKLIETSWKIYLSNVAEIKSYCAIKWRNQKPVTDLELEGLFVIARLGIERAPVRQLQRTPVATATINRHQPNISNRMDLPRDYC